MSGIFDAVSENVLDIFVWEFPSVALGKSCQVRRQRL
jgi:hypothetical protein